MRKLFNGKMKYLFLAPIILMAAFGMFFMDTFDEIQSELFSEKCIEKERELAAIGWIIDTMVERDSDWGSYDYRSIVENVTEELGSSPTTFAAAYSESYELLAHGAETAPSEDLDLRQHPQFLDAVTSNSVGKLPLVSNAGGGAFQEMTVFYRWVPANPNYTGRYLIAIAISKHSIDTQRADWISIGAAALMVATFLLNCAMVGLICYLSNMSAATKMSASSEATAAGDNNYGQ